MWTNIQWQSASTQLENYDYTRLTYFKISLAVQVGEETLSSEFEYVVEELVKIEATDITVPASVATAIDYKVFDGRYAVGISLTVQVTE